MEPALSCAARTGSDRDKDRVRTKLGGILVAAGHPERGVVQLRIVRALCADAPMSSSHTSTPRRRWR